MGFLTRVMKSYRKNGILRFLRIALRFPLHYLTAQTPVGRWLTILDLMRFGRSYNHASWLLDNQSDRIDACIGGSFPFLIYYTETNREMHRQRYEFAASIIENSENVLDAASGTGYGSSIIGKYDSSIDYVGCEIDETSVKYSREYHPKEYVRGDVTHLPFQSDTFEAVTSLETLEHIPRLDQFLTELHRVVKTDSDLVISVPYQDDINSQPEGKSYPHVVEFDLPKLRSLLSHEFEEADINYYRQTKPEGINPENIQPLDNQVADETKQILVHVSLNNH